MDITEVSLSAVTNEFISYLKELEADEELDALLESMRRAYETSLPGLEVRVVSEEPGELALVAHQDLLTVQEGAATRRLAQ